MNKLSKKSAWISTEAVVQIAAFIVRLEARRATYKHESDQDVDKEIFVYNDGVMYGMDICIGGLQGLVKEMELK